MFFTNISEGCDVIDHFSIERVIFVPVLIRSHQTWEMRCGGSLALQHYNLVTWSLAETITLLGTILCSLCSVSCLHRIREGGGGNLECGIRKDSARGSQTVASEGALLIQQPRARWRVDNGSICKQSCVGTRIMLSFPSNQSSGENIGAASILS